MTKLRMFLTGLFGFAVCAGAMAQAAPDLAGGLRAAPPRTVQPLPAEPPVTIQPSVQPLQGPTGPTLLPQTAPSAPIAAPVPTPVPAPVPAPPRVQTAPATTIAPRASAPAPSPKPAPTQSSQAFIDHATTPVGEIHFRGGSLIQSQQQFGRWYETRADGTINYEFFETGTGPDMLELTGPQGQVRLYVDFKDKVVRGQWPGQPPKVIYTITKVTPLANVPPAPQPPIVQPPVVRPPAPQPPALGPIPSPRDMQVATYAGGQFLRLTDNVWRETAADGQLFDYRVLGFDDTRLYLFDDRRAAFVTLSPATRESTIAVNGDYLRAYKILTSVSGPVATPIPTPPGQLSPADRLACERSGGTVRPQGLAGAERCVRPYADGGQVCTDSAQCQGQCRTDANTPAGTPTTGQCQITDSPFGCYAEVRGGVAQPGLCVD